MIVVLMKTEYKNCSEKGRGVPLELMGLNSPLNGGDSELNCIGLWPCFPSTRTLRGSPTLGPFHGGTWT